MIEQTLEALSAGIVMAEASDIDALSVIRSQLVDVQKWATEEGRPDIAEIAETAYALLDDIVGKPDCDGDTALQHIGRSISGLQQAMASPPSAAGGDAEAGDENDSILAEFLSDQEGAVDEMEALVLALGEEDGDAHLDKLKGKLHTLKGEAGVLGLADVSAVCHSIEGTIGDRSGAELSGGLLEAIDWMRRRFDACALGAEPPAPFDIEAACRDAASAGKAAEAPEAAIPDYMHPVELTADPELTGDFIAEAFEHLEQADDQLLALEKNALDSEAINSVFRAFHTIKGLASFLDLTCVQSLAHVAETMLDMARGGKLDLAGAPLALTFEVTDVMKRLIASMEAALAAGDPLVPHASLPSLMGRLQAIIDGKAQAAAPAADSAAPETTPTNEDAPAAGEAERKKVVVRETIKVDAARLDELVDTIGELVISEAMVSQSEELDLTGMQHLPALLTRMDKITRELQEMAMSLRMVPVGSTFRRMARLARDVAKKVGKKIDFVTKGADTELDKTVVDSIGDPLVHMVRNAVDHGIENNEADRIAAGKPAAGRVELRAFHQGGSIHIEIEDDGGGLDAKKILAKAMERGVVKEGDMLSDSEIYMLIFAPGFSTAEAVTDVSGRGVGLDVVRRNIEALRGSVDIRSTLGQGSVFSIRLPLTLAIIDGMIVKVGTERFILPTVSILRMVRPETENLTRVFDRGGLLRIGDDLVPMCRLDRLFDIPDATPDLEDTAAVIVEHGGRRCAFLVDQLLGQQQIVIKPLGPALAGTPGLAGGAIMPDGHVGLILDVASLVQMTGPGDSRTSHSAVPQEQSNGALGPAAVGGS